MSDRTYSFLVELGTALHRAGASSARVEESLSSLAAKLGVEAQFFASPTALLAAFGTKGEQRSYLSRVDRSSVDLIRDERAAHDRALRLHASVASIFKVGAAAILAGQNRLASLRGLHAFADSLAIAGQILDDLEDLPADLDRGRYTFVANVLRAGSKTRATGPALRRGGRMALQRDLAASLVEGRVDEIFREVRKRLSSAARAARRLAIPEAEAHVAAWVRKVETLEERYHHLRVDFALGPLVHRKTANLLDRRSGPPAQVVRGVNH